MRITRIVQILRLFGLTKGCLCYAPNDCRDLLRRRTPLLRLACHRAAFAEAEWPTELEQDLDTEEPTSETAEDVAEDSSSSLEEQVFAVRKERSEELRALDEPESVEMAGASFGQKLP